ncbi:hypothetical protein [Aquabacterium sp.]|uniref:hypothetical protein n=1 Tax=Aquabacterium sp. TaxID=1872578 RepID=UPI0025B892EA|nr:hypothetical protein [Aquabacterium sp.]
MADRPSHQPSLVRRILWLLAGLVLALALILAWQTWRFPSRQIQVAPGRAWRSMPPRQHSA